MATENQGIPPLKSQFEDDADMAELLEEFVSTLSDRITSITTAIQAGEHATLRTLVHQLKGAGGGYGYPTISERAADAERLLISHAGSHHAISIAKPEIERLLQACNAAIRGYTRAA
jgi:HPt (histidine-containing phosphotransfer) domain-containing protein